MKYNSYEEYVEDAKKYYADRDLTVPVEHMILSRRLFDIFDGVIEFGPGSKELVNAEDGCKCTPTISDEE